MDAAQFGDAVDDLVAGTVSPADLYRAVQHLTLEGADLASQEGKAVLALALNLTSLLVNRKRVSIEQLRTVSTLAREVRGYTGKEFPLRKAGLALLRLAEDNSLPAGAAANEDEAAPEANFQEGPLGPVTPVRTAEPVPSETQPVRIAGPRRILEQAPIPRAAVGPMNYVLTQHDINCVRYEERDLLFYLRVSPAHLTAEHGDQLLKTASNMRNSPQDASRLSLQAAKILYERVNRQDEKLLTAVAYYAQHTGRRLQREAPRQDASATEYFLEALQAFCTHPLSLNTRLNEQRRSTIANILTSVICLHDQSFRSTREGRFEHALRHVFIDTPNAFLETYGAQQGKTAHATMVRDVSIALARILHINRGWFADIINVAPETRAAVSRLITQNPHLLSLGGFTATDDLAVLFGELGDLCKEADNSVRQVLASFVTVGPEEVGKSALRLADSLNSTKTAHLMDLEREQLKDLQKFLRALAEYYGSELFASRRNYYEQVRGWHSRMIMSARSIPTRLSVASILPVVEHGWKLINAHFTILKEQAAPRLGIGLLKDQVPLQLGQTGTKTVELQVEVANTGDDAASEVDVQLSVAPESNLIDEEVALHTLEGRRSKVFPVKIQLSKSLSSLNLTADMAYLHDGKAVKLPPVHMEVTHSSPRDLSPFLNPLVYTREAIKDPTRLQGREDHMKNLKKWIAGADQVPMIVHGQKRVGKSSVGSVFGQEVKASSPDYVVVYFEWGEYCASPLGNVMHRILQREVAIRVRERLGELCPPLPTREEVQADPLGVFGDYLYAVALVKPSTRFLIIIDEFDHIALSYRKGYVNDEFFTWLRGLMHRGLVRFMFIGGENLPNVLTSVGEEFNRSLFTVIDHLDAKGSQDLVQKPAAGGLVYSKASLGRMYDYCDGNAFYTTELAIETLQVMNGKQEGSVSIIDLEQAVSSLLGRLKEPAFAHLMRDEVHYATLRAVADTAHARAQGRTLFFKNPVPQSAIIQSPSVSHLESKTVLSALDILQSRGVLKRELIGEVWHYRIRVGLFAQWLLNHASLERRGIDQADVSVWEGDGNDGSTSVLLGQDD